MKFPNPYRWFKYIVKSNYYLRKIEKAFSKREYQECISISNDLLSYNPNDFFGHYYRGLSLTELKLFDEALISFEAARSSLQSNKAKSILTEYSCDLPLRVSIVNLKMRKFDKAKEILEINIQQHPECVSSFIKLARIEEDEENYIKAIETINLGLENNLKNKALNEEKKRLTYNYIEDKKYKNR